MAALNDLPDPLSLPTGIVSGRLTLPASKSVAQRVLNLALLSGAPLTIDNPPADEDSLAFAGAIEALGWDVMDVPPGMAPPLDRAPDGTWKIVVPTEREHGATIDCASSGTALRLLVASLSTLHGFWTITGSEQLARRPIGGLVEALRSAGVRLEGLAAPGAGLPLRIEGGHWFATGQPVTEIEVDASTSSQYLSALLMAAANAHAPDDRRPVTITATGLVSEPYVDLTLDWMRRFGVRVERSGSRFTVHPGFDPPDRIRLEGDWSSACYPAAGAALIGSTVTLEGLDSESRQADRGFLHVLDRIGGIEPIDNPQSGSRKPGRRGSRRSGAQTAGGQVGEATGEGAPSAADLEDLVVTGTGRIRGIDIDMNTMPDQVPTLACLAPFAAGATTIRGVAHLRHKESDRLAVLARELGRLGVPVEERADGLAIEGVWHDAEPPEDAVIIDPESDHRIAMAVAVLASRRPGVSMADPAVVGKSWAGFWQDWAPLFAEEP